jgi:hypothetical protein
VVSDGAYARVRTNGWAGPGDLVTDTDGRVDLWVRIEAIPEIDVSHFKVFVNCDEVLNIPCLGTDGVAKYDGILEVPVPADGHIVVVGFGQDLLPRGMPEFGPSGIPRFTTNAVYVDVDGNGIYDSPGGKACAYTLDPPI